MPRVVTVGRLDLTTEGLLLLTNDGELARALELPGNGFERAYRARAHGEVTDQKLTTLKDGLIVDGEQFGAIHAELDRQLGTNAWLTVTLSEGKKREVRRALEAVGLKVNRLIRTRYGPFELGDLKPGAVSEMPLSGLPEEVGKLIKPAFQPIAARSRFEHRTKSRTKSRKPTRS
ncbi:MAG: pseudouridine synthase [Pseudomonadota bacterium]